MACDIFEKSRLKSKFPAVFKDKKLRDTEALLILDAVKDGFPVRRLRIEELSITPLVCSNERMSIVSI